MKNNNSLQKVNPSVSSSSERLALKPYADTFKLSEKGFTKIYRFAGERRLYLEEDFKEFIRLLKERIWSYEHVEIKDVMDEIDKLSGFNEEDN